MKSFLIALETLCFVFLSDQVNAEMRSKCQILFSPQMSNSLIIYKTYLEVISYSKQCFVRDIKITKSHS